MNQDQSGRRVVAIAPMPPEKSAYALARYSRSPDSIEEVLNTKWGTDFDSTVGAEPHCNRGSGLRPGAHRILNRS